MSMIHLSETGISTCRDHKHIFQKFRQVLHSLCTKTHIVFSITALQFEEYQPYYQQKLYVPQNDFKTNKIPLLTNLITMLEYNNLCKRYTFTFQLWLTFLRRSDNFKLSYQICKGVKRLLQERAGLSSQTYEVWVE